MDASQELRGIAARLREAGQGGALRRVSAAIRQEAKPLVDDVKAAASERLPHRGGLAARVAHERVTVSVRTGARTAGVSLRMKAHDAGTTDRGYVRHPVFADGSKERSEWRWVTQLIPDAIGWWTDTLRARSEQVTPKVEQAMRDVAAQIERGL